MTYDDRCDVGVCIHLDTNSINARGKLEAVTQLEKWKANDVIMLEMAAAAHDEAFQGNSPARQAKASDYIYNFDTHAPREQATRDQIEQVLFPGGAANQNQRTDVEICFVAGRCMCWLVTLDGDSKSQPGGILGNRDRLRELGVEAMRPEEAVADIRKKIEVRDNNARFFAEKLGTPLPD